MFSMLKNLWQYRAFIFSSIGNEFSVRFARSKLGGLWMIIHPLTQVAIYAMILSSVLSAKLSGIDSKYAYAIYLIAGMLAWSLFSEIVSRCLTLFTDQGNLMKKMRFPRITLPAIVVGTGLVNNFFLFVAVLLVLACLDSFPGIEVFWLMPLYLLLVAMAVGVGLIFGVLNVFVRDVGQVVPIMLQILFWFTPIVYPISIIPAELKELVELNPLYSIVTGFHEVLVFHRSPVIEQATFLLFLYSLGLMLLGLFIFRRAAPEMVDSL
ncbi:ABC transporter permease [Pseudomonas chlororaphis]|uniref:ABC transporter permease n=1 Tax=Pseudomonas chlororaphis TaxID=587753 RepID=UPI0039E0EFAC